MHARLARQEAAREPSDDDDDDTRAARSLGHARVRTAKSPRDTHRAKLPRNVTTSRRNVPGRPPAARAILAHRARQATPEREIRRMKTPNKASFFISRYRRFSSGADRTRETDRPGGWAAVIWPARARHARVDETGYRTDRSPAAGRCCIASPCTWTLARDQVNVEAAAARAGVPCRLPTRPSHGHAWVPRPGGPAVALGVCPAPATSLEGGRRRAADGRPRPPPN